LGGEERFGGCEMACTDELKAADAPLTAKLSEPALRFGGAGAGEHLLVAVILARLAQRAECR
jgi:hypothetical protein